MNIDAKHLILGRMATQAAKKALLGEKVTIVNTKDVIITGDRKMLVARYVQKRARGIPTKGPFQPRHPDKFVKRTIRGMLPSNARGREALERVWCYPGIPADLKDTEFETIKAAHIDNSLVSKYISVGELCKNMGGKDE
tara:strand:+ start:2796 stop:3212 length:417 start_codon:yes stop_codon:yes gene_type:complete